VTRNGVTSYLPHRGVSVKRQSELSNFNQIDAIYFVHVIDRIYWDISTFSVEVECAGWLGILPIAITDLDFDPFFSTIVTKLLDLIDLI